MLQTATVDILNLLSDITEGHSFDFQRCFFNPVSGKLETTIDLGEYMSYFIPLSTDVREGSPPQHEHTENPTQSQN
ncbi:hypothetical protein V6N13_000804 [Hibiscus sabdariffa]|uniref:Uncharacterized protein n=1 Tax=Hibiscus sabdariffa TaxID=183260 RepID=A0ABR2G6F0_9ROSI